MQRQWKPDSPTHRHTRAHTQTQHHTKVCLQSPNNSRWSFWFTISLFLSQSLFSHSTNLFLVFSTLCSALCPSVALQLFRPIFLLSFLLAFTLLLWSLSPLSGLLFLFYFFCLPVWMIYSDSLSLHSFGHDLHYLGPTCVFPAGGYLSWQGH